VGVAADVVTEAGAVAAVRRQSATEHADGGGLAASVGTEEAVDRATLDLHRQVMHHLAAAKRLRQAMDIDRDVGCRRRGHRLAATGVLALRNTPIGWPTRKTSGREGRA